MHALVDPVTGQDLTLDQTRALLGSHLRTSVGAEELDLNLNRRGDLSAQLGAGHVARDADKLLHADCTFDLDRELTWGTSLVRPYATLRGAGLVGRSYLGAFSLQTPVRRAGQPYAVTGLDRLALLDRFVGDTYVVDAGVEYLTAIRGVFTAAGIDLASVQLDTVAAGKTLPVAKPWPLLPGDDGEQGGYTWLNIINDLLKAIGYRGLYTDELGRFRSGPYLTAASRTADWTFDATSKLGVLLAAARELAQDTWGLPNRWTGYQRNAGQGAVPLQFTRTDAAGVQRRGGGALGLWPAQPVALDAADQASLEAQVNEIADRDLQAAATITHETSPFPIAGHADVYAVTDPAIGVLGRVAGNAWSQAWSEIGLLADTTHTWRLVA